MADPKKIYIRPCEVTTAGGAKVLAKLPYPGDPKRSLPAEGAWVPRFGQKGGWWRRRMAEGACEEVPPQRPKTKKGGE